MKIIPTNAVSRSILSLVEWESFIVGRGYLYNRVITDESLDFCNWFGALVCRLLLASYLKDDLVWHI